MNKIFQPMFLLFAALAMITNTPEAIAAFTFAAGDFYTANFFSDNILQYSVAGSPVGSFSVAPDLADEIRGVAFGPDGLLYATAVRESGFAVLAFNSSGALQQTYSMNSVYLAGNISYGKIAVDNQHIYVAGAGVVTRFNINDPTSGSIIYGNNQLFDVKILPSGNLLAASAYEVNEITASGTFVRSIALQGNFFTDIRGIEYDPLSNNLFVTHLGHTGFFFQLMRIDGTSGLLEKSVTLNYADDIFLTANGDLVVGSRTQAPHIYTQDLDQIGTLGTSPQMFVTEFAPVPEPSTYALLLTAGLSLLIMRRKSHRNASFWSNWFRLGGRR